MCFCCVAFVVRFVFCGPCCCVFPRLWVLFPLVLVLLVFRLLCVLLVGFALLEVCSVGGVVVVVVVLFLLVVVGVF